MITVLIFGTAICSVLTGTVACADEPADLQRAIQLFEEGQYLPAQELLSHIDRAKLDEQGQHARDDYLGRVQVAITMYEKSLRDLEDAGTAASEGDPDAAGRLLHAVLDNEYAPDAARRKATADLQRLPDAHPSADAEPDASGAQSEAVEAQTPPPTKKVINGERARVVTGEADDMVSAGRYEEARRLYEDALRSSPGYPGAVAGLARVQAHERNLQGSREETLIERIRRDNRINWQRTVAEYRDVEAMIRDHVNSERFDDAAQLLIRAKQVVEAGKQFADPPVKYESLHDELNVLSESVQSAERQYNERHVAELRRGIEQQRARHLKEMAGRRQQQVDALMDQALQHRKDGDLRAALNVLRQVQAVDPKYLPARWMMNDLEDLQQYQYSRRLRHDLNEQTRRTFNGVEESKIPWFQLLRYDEKWPEIIARPERQRPGVRRRGGRLISALDKRIPVDFRRDPFGDVVERLAEANRLNLMVNWADLKRVGVDRDTPITLSLPREITLKRALTEVLDQAGAGDVELGFDVDDEGVRIASRETLDRRVYTAVYDINDLLMEIPMFNDSPVTDLTQANQKGRPLATDSEPRWKHGDDDDDSPETDPDRPARARRIIELIQEQVAPDSWAGRGGGVGKIDEFNGQLVVTQNSAAQQSVGNLLGKLREQRAIQIAVEARFITVTSNYLEDLGIDLNFVLNSGNAGFDFAPSASGPLTDPVLGSALLLPRTFSRLGFAPSVPGLGSGLVGNVVPTQPFQNPALVPQGRSGGGGNLTPIPITSRVTSFTDPSSLGSDVPGSFAGQTMGPALNIFGSFLDNIQVDFLIRATQADSRSTVLTAPQLVLFNGQRSWVAVTIQQNFVSQLQPVVATGAVAQAPITGTVNSGAVLDVHATVNSDKRYVTMTLRPGITRLLNLQTIPFSGGGAGGGFGGGGGALNAFIQLPTLSSQRVQTTVSVPDGGTLLIGGQKLATETAVEAGVPILSRIPILKRLYTSRTMVKDEQTLIMLVKPHILIPTEQEELAFPSFR